MTTNSSISVNIQNVANQIEEYLADLKKQDASKTTKELEQELIEYILAQIAASTGNGDDSGKTQEIAGQINNTIQSYTSDIQKCDNLSSQVKEIANDPTNQTQNSLSALTAILALLQNDLKTGDLSNLPSTIS